MRSRLRKGALGALAVTTAAGGLVLGAAPASADASHTWNPPGANRDWSNAANWTPAGGIHSDVTLVFAGQGTGNTSNDVPGLTDVVIDVNAGTYNFIGTEGFELDGWESVGDQTVAVPIEVTAADVPFVVGSGTVTVQSAIGGTGGIVKTGAGTLRLSGTNTYTGNTVITQGVLNVDGSTATSGLTSVPSGRLAGDGTVGDLEVNGGTVTPGDTTGTTTGRLTVDGNFLLAAGSSLQVEIAGATAGTTYDQLRVNGTVQLAGTLTVTATFAGSAGQEFVLIDNDGADAVSGTFTGVPEGAIVTLGGNQYRVSYQGGTGNDVVLTQQNEAAVRLAGADRVATAIAISQDSFPTSGSADAVVLARSDNFADALAGTPLAVRRNGPLLLTSSTSLDPTVRTEIQRVLTTGKTVYLLGGSAALSDAIATELTAAGYVVTRYGGENRYETAVNITRDGLGDPTTLLLASGENFPDALAAGAAAAKVNGGILLTQGSIQAAPTQAYLSTRTGTTVIAIGGPAAAAVNVTEEIVGDDRYDTATRVAARFFTGPTSVGVASGLAFPDALSGGAHAGKKGVPILLTDSVMLPPVVRTYLISNQATLGAAHIYGGPSAVSDTVVTAVANAIRGV